VVDLYVVTRVAIRRAERRDFKVRKSQWSRATTTPLVKEVFEAFFPEQLDKEEGKESKVLHRAVKIIPIKELL
jgi:hypothetical protein